MQYNVKQPGWLLTYFTFAFDEKELTEIYFSDIKIRNIVA
jgi:hypothetical protein